jgi:ferredoxin
MTTSSDSPKPSARQVWAPVRKKWAKEARFWRYGIQALVLLFITWIAIAHQWVGGGPLGSPSIEAYCPFGAVEGLYQWIITGTFMQRVHPSSFIVLAALIGVTILSRKAFCSWICPFGTIQEWIGKLGKKIFGKKYNPTGRWDLALRPLKYVVLIGIVALTWTTGTMVFREYDPFLAFFHFGLDFTEHWIGNSILIAVLAGSLIIDRFWCRYLCPLGALIGVIGKAGSLGIKRNDATCTLCDACNKVCPMHVGPMEYDSVNSAECLQCMECASVCPEPDTLQLKLAKWNVRPAVFAVAVFIVFFGILGAGRATGLWVTAGKGSLTDAFGRPDPAGIRGWMNMEYVSKGYSLPLPLLRERVGLPEKVDSQTPLKKIAEKYNMTFDPHKVRDVVADLLKEKGVETAAKKTVVAAASKTLDPDQIRGTWTLGELTEKSRIPKRTFAKALGFPEDTPKSKKLREIAQPMGKSVEHFRDVVRKTAVAPKMPGLHSEQIRGYWTLKELTTKSGISKEVFAKKVGFPPDTKGKKRLKDIVHPMGKEVDEFRKVVKESGVKP